VNSANKKEEFPKYLNISIHKGRLTNLLGNFNWVLLIWYISQYSSPRVWGSINTKNKEISREKQKEKKNKEYEQNKSEKTNSILHFKVDIPKYNTLHSISNSDWYFICKRVPKEMQKKGGPGKNTSVRGTNKLKGLRSFQ